MLNSQTSKSLVVSSAGVAALMMRAAWELTVNAIAFHRASRASSKSPFRLTPVLSTNGLHSVWILTLVDNCGASAFFEHTALIKFHFLPLCAIAVSSEVCVACPMHCWCCANFWLIYSCRIHRGRGVLASYEENRVVCRFFRLFEHAIVTLALLCDSGLEPVSIVVLAAVAPVLERSSLTKSVDNRGAWVTAERAVRPHIIVLPIHVKKRAWTQQLEPQIQKFVSQNCKKSRPFLNQMGRFSGILFLKS